MKQFLIISKLIILSLLLVGCKVSSTNKSYIRTDGLYCKIETVGSNNYHDCYRFYPDGKLLFGSFKLPPKEIWSVFHIRDISKYKLTTYKIKRNKVIATFYNSEGEKTHKIIGQIADNSIFIKEINETDDSKVDWVDEFSIEFIKLE